MEYDFDFVCNNIAEISRIPVRVYKGNAFLSFYSPIPFKIDPAKTYIDQIIQDDSSIKYFITPLSQYYGIIHVDDYRIIFGPTSEIALSKTDLYKLANELNVPSKESDAFFESINSITRMPVHMFLHLLVLNYYYFTKEKIDPSSLLLSRTSNNEENTNISINSYNDNANERIDSHTTYNFERQMVECIKTGNQQRLSELFSSASVGVAGMIGKTYLSQLQNIFISAATIASRAAIEGGLPPEEALQLSDYYINHCEKLTKAEYILKLQYSMIMDYTKKVHSLYHGNTYTKAVHHAIKYIHEHISENPDIDEISEYAMISRSQLSARFKQETGMTITEFMHKEKVEKAKDYLLRTDMSLLEISIALGFSSQSHFQKIFKEVEKLTPKEFKDLNFKK